MDADLELTDLSTMGPCPDITQVLGLSSPEDSIELPPGALSLEFLQAIYRSATQPMARRLKAASIAIQYESPKLAVTAVVEGSDSLAARLNRAIERSARVDAYRLIQAAPTAANGAAVYDDPATVSAAAQRRPMAQLIRRR
jgi:hypothetical protein